MSNGTKVVRCSSGRELMKSNENSNKFASDPNKRCDVGLKCLFSASGSTLIGWGLGYKIQCLMFRGSLDLLDDRALLKKACLIGLILVLNLLRTSRNLFQILTKFFLCAKYLSTFRSFWSSLMSSLFSQGAGGCVIIVLRR